MEYVISQESSAAGSPPRVKPFDDFRAEALETFCLSTEGSVCSYNKIFPRGLHDIARDLVQVVDFQNATDLRKQAS